MHSTDSINSRLLNVALLVAFQFVLHSVALAQENNQPPAGFKAIFDGRDINDWTGGLTRDPREIAALSPQDRAAWDAEMKKGIDTHWRVEDGVLVSDGKDPFLATKGDYGDIELWVDWQIKPRGDSGIYLRGTPQVQIWDPSDPAVNAHGAEKGSGGLWNNKQNERFPSEVADKPIGEWNRMNIRMVGPYVSVTLNGREVVENVVMENYYDRNIPVFAHGPIYLQTHGAESRFRNVFVREIPAEEANQTLAKIAGDTAAFQPIFNGQDLSGWKGAVDDYEVKDGAVQCKPGRGGNLLTDDEYDDFVLRFEFKLPPGGNNGVAIRAPDSADDLAYAAMELQVLDDTAAKYNGMKDYQSHGSLYGLAPAHRGYLRPVGEWNYEEITVDGDRVAVRLNGYEILNADLNAVRQNPLDGEKHPGASRTSGHIGLCGHNDPVAFRNLRVKRLPAN